MNAERILVASESVGDGRWFIEKAVQYSKDRVIVLDADGRVLRSRGWLERLRPSRSLQRKVRNVITT